MSEIKILGEKETINKQAMILLNVKRGFLYAYCVFSLTPQMTEDVQLPLLKATIRTTWLETWFVASSLVSVFYQHSNFETVSFVTQQCTIAKFSLMRKK